MKSLFSPRGIAFVGASPDPERYNGRVLQYALAAGFDGAIYPVNPKYAEVFGQPCYPELSGIEGPVDVVVALVGPARMPDLLRQCRKKGVDYLIALGDLVPNDARDADGRLAEIRALIDAGGPRIIGPVCVGLLRPATRLAMTMSSGLLAGAAPKGPIGLISQSGGILSSALDRAHQFGAGFSALVSSGAEFDLNLADYLEFLVEDDATHCIAIYAEKILEPARFLSLADAAHARDKPVLLLKGGVSRRGAAVALTHSGAIASDREIEDAALRRHRILRVNDIDDLVMTARVLAENRVAPHRGVAAVSQSGGYCSVVADALERGGVPLADPAPATVRRILDQTPVPRVGNPHDSASGPPGNNAPNTHAALLSFQDDQNVGATLYCETMYMYQEQGHELQLDVARQATKPHLVCWQGGKATEGVIRSLRSRGVTVFDNLNQTVAAVAGLYDYARLSAARRPCPGRDHEAVTLPAGSGPVSDAEMKRLLRIFDVPLVEERWVESPEEAARAAAALGFPVVIKGLAPGETHKNEAGLVTVGISDEAQARDACAAMVAHGRRLDGFLIQTMVERGIEFIVGAKRDPQYGAAILLGFGGLFVEAMRPPVFEMAPVDIPLAEEMIEAIDPKGILNGYRSGRSLNRQALAETIVSVSRLALACGDRLESIDLNPVMVTETGAAAVDAVLVLNPPENRLAERSAETS